MHILLLGATGNLGLRMLPALLAHNHTVVAYVRSREKLLSLISKRLAERVTIHIGDALDTNAVEAALRQYGCDGVMNTAGNVAPPWREQYLGKIAISVSNAAVRVGKQRGKVLRAWFIGGLTSLVYPYPGNDKGWTVQDFMPNIAMAQHHLGTERALKEVSTEDLEWSLLCVAWMWPNSREIDVLDEPQHHDLATEVGVMPDWRASWVGNLPIVGRTLDLFWNFSGYSTKLEDVADLVAEDFESGGGSFIGHSVGMKDREIMRMREGRCRQITMI